MNWIDEDVSAPGANADRAATKAIAAWRREWLAVLTTLIRYAAVDWIETLRLKIARTRLAHQIQNAADMEIAAIVTGTAIAIKCAVLVDATLVVAWNSGSKAALVIIAPTGAFWVKTVNPAVVVIVDAIAALGATGYAARGIVAKLNRLGARGRTYQRQPSCEQERRWSDETKGHQLLSRYVPLSRSPNRTLGVLLFVASTLASNRARADDQGVTSRIVLVSFDATLRGAVAVALAAWNTELVAATSAAMASSTPGTADAARALARGSAGDSVVWITQSQAGTAVWIYDANSDSVAARRLTSAPPFDEPSAAAVALTIKTLLRHSRVAPASERFEAPAASDPTLQPDAASQLAIARARRRPMTLVVGAGVRSRRGAPNEPHLDAAIEVGATPRLFLGGRIRVGLGGRQRFSEQLVDLSSVQAIVELGASLLRRRRLEAEMGLGVGGILTRLTTDGPGALSKTVTRVNPSLDGRASVGLRIAQTVRVAIEGSASVLALRQRYELSGALLFELPRLNVGLGLNVGVRF